MISLSRTTRLAASGLVAATLLVGGLPAGADAGVEITSLTAVAGSNGLASVDGRFDVAGAPVILEDAVGDGLTPGSDLAGAEVELVSNKDIAFRIVLADALPQVGNTTATMLFWEMNAGGKELQLSAMHNRYTAPGAWSYQLETCAIDEASGTNQCTGTNVTGSYADGVIEMVVPLSSLGIGFGGRITQAGDGIYSTVGAAGLIWNGTDLQDGLAFNAITIPTVTATVSSGDVTTPATISSGNRFRTDVTAAVGQSVSATVCVDLECATSTTTVK